MIALVTLVLSYMTVSTIVFAGSGSGCTVTIDRNSTITISN